MSALPCSWQCVHVVCASFIALVSYRDGTETAPIGGETGGQRGPAPGTPAPRRPATAAGTGVNEHATSVPSEAQRLRHRGRPCWHRPSGSPMLASPHRSPKLLAAAQPHPLIKHCCGAAATVDEHSVRTAERRPLSRRSPCSVSRVRRRPSPLNLQPRSCADFHRRVTGDNRAAPVSGRHPWPQATGGSVGRGDAVHDRRPVVGKREPSRRIGEPLPGRRSYNAGYLAQQGCTGPVLE